MGCFKKPKKAKASQSEMLLAQTAREQYGYYKAHGVPLEIYEIGQVNKIDSPEQRQLSVDRSANSARNSMSALQLNGRPGASTFSDMETNKAIVLAGAGMSGSMSHDQRRLERNSRILSLGRGLSASATEGARRSASYGAGVQAAEDGAANMVNGAGLNLAGQLTGTGLGLYGKKKGWFE